MSAFHPTEKSFEHENGADDPAGLYADGSLTMERSDVETQTDPAFAKKTIRKIDLYVLPILAVLYSFSLIDRVNIS
jgi:hypothetical protein